MNNVFNRTFSCPIVVVTDLFYTIAIIRLISVKYAFQMRELKQHALSFIMTYFIPVSLKMTREANIIVYCEREINHNFHRRD